MDSFKIGENVVVERRGRPWRRATIASFENDVITTTNGHSYDARSNIRLQVPHGVPTDRLVKATPERLAFLEVRDFLQSASSIDLSKLSLQDAVDVVTLVRSLRAKLC
ncbi:hypothetical protein [Deinococcus yavapaiensis]|uniref:hypothetical protein n=1 Tax=Deinococcus yavapaiensis TaxID=309889 RepID=UPI0011B3FDC3|nr:hypothetical protein [Deinococcus yavapaiensis]